MPLVTLDRISMAYGHLPLLDQASFRMESRERVCVIGRNGTGKSTLLQVVSGDLIPQDGAVWREAGLRIGRLAQDALVTDDRRNRAQLPVDGPGPGAVEPGVEEVEVVRGDARP